ncbi:MAG: Magnesium transport protein CorA [Pedosphaera sp.]|nr:Magnesium transport protein CorA [Pedosphaera sp.]
MIRSFVFSTAGHLEGRDINPSAMPAILADPARFLWIDLEAPPEAEALSILADIFHFHPLSIEDCIQPSPFPKVEDYNPGPDDKFAHYLFMVIHAVDYNRKDCVFATSELNFFLGKNFLVTYHDVPLRTINAIADRCQKGALNGARGPDRVAHTLLDTLVENYKPALDELGVEISELEQQALQNPDQRTMNKILQTKKEVLHLRRIIGPQRDALARLASGEYKLIRPHLIPYFRDVYDSLFHIGELAQSYTDSLTGILQVYLSMSSNRTGEVVKLLTIITVLTTPMMMVGTWYGMNFKNMPELQSPHGYLVASLFVALSTAATYWYFKRNKWL